MVVLRPESGVKTEMERKDISALTAMKLLLLDVEKNSRMNSNLGFSKESITTIFQKEPAKKHYEYTLKNICLIPQDPLRSIKQSRFI